MLEQTALHNIFQEIGHNNNVLSGAIWKDKVLKKYIFNEFYISYICNMYLYN